MYQDFKIIDILGVWRIFNVYPVNYNFSTEKEFGVVYIFMNNKELVYCGKDSNFPKRINEHPINHDIYFFLNQSFTCCIALDASL